MMKKSLSTLANIWDLSGPMAGIRGYTGEMLGGRGCGFTERLKISIVVQIIFLDSTVDSSPCPYSKSSYFNSAIVWQIKFSSGEGMAERPVVWEADLKDALAVKPLMSESL